MDEEIQRRSKNKKEDEFGGMEGSERGSHSIHPYAPSVLRCFPQTKGQKGREQTAQSGKNPKERKRPLQYQMQRNSFHSPCSNARTSGASNVRPRAFATRWTTCTSATRANESETLN
mmetsp:Transcript_8475/g.30237  ORF Transcript_8475/g.30237 Transcript_8475/m.30237 type:complete len:117 (-) Transcript_8475:490-840(-)